VRFVSLRTGRYQKAADLPDSLCVPPSLVAASGQRTMTNLDVRLANSLFRAQWGNASSLSERNDWTQYMHVERGASPSMQRDGITMVGDVGLKV
jgi:hypothetical protein